MREWFGVVSGGRKLQSADRQMSEAFIYKYISGNVRRFQDAYTYFTRDEVFSNAQTGNVVLMSQNFMTGQWGEGLRYLFPICFCHRRGSCGADPELLLNMQKNFTGGRWSCWSRSWSFWGGIYAGKTGYAGNRTGILFLRPSGADLPKGWRKCHMPAPCVSESLRSGTAALSAYMRERKPRLLHQPYAISPLFSCLLLAQELAADFQWLTAKEPSGYPASCFSSASF